MLTQDSALHLGSSCEKVTDRGARGILRASDDFLFSPGNHCRRGLQIQNVYKSGVWAWGAAHDLPTPLEAHHIWGVERPRWLELRRQ